MIYIDLKRKGKKKD
ncbi:hypothetical protein BXY_34470 [Bacteroides xylanisolvens XB1A]|uniref:Uncharacterized protein n=1 Tax=Bacteroides xylanisolvens XB1A TaxID=657309 RepID=D6D1Y9_9BACE|nr:hypothetical protein BXY_34470 [Bacteroides xylanisolvens XB1A]